MIRDRAGQFASSFGHGDRVHIHVINQLRQEVPRINMLLCGECRDDLS
jgi:hypothetical protein